jgi:hypothetical protein
MKYLLLAIVTGVSLLFAMRTKAEITTETPDIQSSEDLPSMPVSSSNQTIAVRNNNPLNIRETSDNWQGLSSPRASKGWARMQIAALGQYHKLFQHGRQNQKITRKHILHLSKKIPACAEIH